MHIVIIGNSAAGLSAAHTVRKIKPKARITIISDEPGPAYARCLIPEVVAGTRKVSGISYVPQKFYQDFEIELLSGLKAISVNAKDREVTLSDGRTVTYDRLLLATGASPVLPEWSRSNLPGVFTLRRLEQAVELSRQFPRCTSAVVVGGGLVSLKAAYALKRRGLQDVTVVIKSPHILTKQLDEESAALLEKEFTGIGIRLVYGVEPTAAIPGPQGTVQAVELEDGRRLPADLVVIGKGVQPNIELLQQAGGKVDRGIIVNDHMETSLESIYAAGDCIEVTDLITGTKTTSGLWTLAVEQGRCAGYNMAGQARRYPPPVTRLNSAQFGATPFISVGDVQGGDERVVYKDHRVYRKLCFKDGRLVGFIMVGRVDRAGIYTSLVKQQRKLRGWLKDRLIDGTVNGADITTAFK